MRIRTLIPFLSIAALGCAADTADEAATSEAPQEYASTADAASLAAFVDGWATHYNMGHGSMVADFFAEDGLDWSGAGGMAFGREAIAASLQGAIDASSPHLTVAMDDQVISGSFAVARGTYSTEGTVDGEATSNSGYWMSFSEMIDGEWKLHGLVSNLDSEQATPGFAATEMPEPLENASLAAEGAEYFQTHFNMGHAGMVAERYAEDAVSMPAGGAAVTGREAIQAGLETLTSQGAQVSITPFAAGELDNGMVAAVGTYTMEIAGATTNGYYANLAQPSEDGTVQLVWSLTGVIPGGM